MKGVALPRFPWYGPSLCMKKTQLNVELLFFSMPYLLDVVSG